MIDTSALVALLEEEETASGLRSALAAAVSADLPISPSDFRRSVKTE